MRTKNRPAKVKTAWRTGEPDEKGWYLCYRRGELPDDMDEARVLYWGGEDFAVATNDGVVDGICMFAPLPNVTKFKRPRVSPGR